MADRASMGRHRPAPAAEILPGRTVPREFEANRPSPESLAPRAGHEARPSGPAAPASHDFGRLPASAPSGAPAVNVLQAREDGDGAGKNRTGMPDRLKTGLEALSGMDLSGVRVHRNSRAPERVQALAYTQGPDIHVAPGQEHHLPHEGWHAVQQMAGRVKPTTTAGGVAINDDRGLEREADVMGKKALQGKLD